MKRVKGLMYAVAGVAVAVLPLCASPIPATYQFASVLLQSCEHILLLLVVWAMACDAYEFGL